jgi:hypothetical protein
MVLPAGHEGDPWQFRQPNEQLHVVDAPAVSSDQVIIVDFRSPATKAFQELPPLAHAYVSLSDKISDTLDLNERLKLQAERRTLKKSLSRDEHLTLFSYGEALRAEQGEKPTPFPIHTDNITQFDQSMKSNNSSDLSDLSHAWRRYGKAIDNPHLSDNERSRLRMVRRELYKKLPASEKHALFDRAQNE